MSPKKKKEVKKKLTRRNQLKRKISQMMKMKMRLLYKRMKVRRVNLNQILRILMMR